MGKLSKSRAHKKMAMKKLEATQRNNFATAASSDSGEESEMDFGPLSEKLVTDIQTSDTDEKQAKSGEFSDELVSDDSEYELQVALKVGILQQNGINVLAEKPREKINKQKEMEAKLKQFKKIRPWIETLAITVPADLTFTGSVHSDFEREEFFKMQARAAVSLALPKLKALNVPIFRPEDYFAEMAKSDTHMHKVRRRILDVQKDKEQREAARRLREEKRFAIKVQGASEERKRKEKRKLLEAVKRHRKGVKGQLKQMLNNASTYDLDGDENAGKIKSKMSRTARDRKFGYGGRKKRSKQNDKESFENPFGSHKRPNKFGNKFGKKFSGKFGKKGRGIR